MPSPVGDLVALGFILNEDDELVVTDDTYADQDIIVMGDCYVGGNLDCSADISCGGELNNQNNSTVTVFTGIIYDLDSTGNKLHFVMPFGGWVKAVHGVLWKATGGGAATIVTKVDAIDKNDLELAFAAGDAEAHTDSIESGYQDYARFDRGDCVFLYTKTSTIVNPDVTVGIVLEVVRTQEET